MTTEQIANRLVECCRKGEFETAQKELFATDAVSNEPFPTPDFEQVTKGLDAIIAKGHTFDSMVEKMHGITLSDPLIAGNTFAVTLAMDVTMKGKERMKMSERCVYQVKNEKIISESFHM